MSILLAILMFGILIFVHELGHFIFAKLNNVKVLKFSLGFGPKLIGRKIGETEYVISAIPLGGYVKMYGEDPDDEVIEADRGRSFKAQSLRARAVIVLAGPVFNILLTFVIYTVMLGASIELPVPDLKNLMPVVDEVVAELPAAEAGMKAGDRIIRIGDSEISTWIDVINNVSANPGKKLEFELLRGKETVLIAITPRTDVIKDRQGKDLKIGRVGIRKSGQGLYTIITSNSIWDAPLKGAYATYKMGTVIFESIWMTITGEISVKNVGGPITIMTESNKAASAGALAYFLFMALISVNLGVLNLLPVPILDGGHLLIMSIEALRGEPLSDAVMAVTQKVGMALLLALMVLVMYNDLFRIFSGKAG